MKITKAMGRACASYDYDDFSDPMLVIAALREIGASDEEIMGAKLGPIWAKRVPLALEVGDHRMGFDALVSSRVDLHFLTRRAGKPGVDAAGQRDLPPLRG